jgi:protein ImuA
MATSAVAREAVLSLRRTIAKIEGRLPEQLEEPVRPNEATVLRRGGAVEAGAAGANRLRRLPTGAERLDAALQGGLPFAALTEIHGCDARDAGAATGFVLALAGRARRERRERDEATPFLWVGAGQAFPEAGIPHAPGLAGFAGLQPTDLLFSSVPRLLDALWIAEEAARLDALCAVVLEVRGNPSQLDLTATRRLHRRAQLAGRPVFLLRQSAAAEPTAAPFRLHVSAAPAAPRRILSGPLAGSIGHAAFTVAIGKGRAAHAAPFILEWNPDELSFRERPAQDHGAVVPASAGTAHPAAAAGTVLALKFAS